MTLEEKLYVHKVEDALKRMEENFNSLQLLQTKIAELADIMDSDNANGCRKSISHYSNTLRQLTVVQ